MPAATTVQNTQGRYVTDGTRLLRILDASERTEPANILELEDCLTLEIVVVEVRELPRLALRPVPTAA